MPRSRPLRSALRRPSPMVALTLSAVAAGLTVTGAAEAARDAAVQVVSTPKPRAVLRLGENGRFPASAIPTVARAREAGRVGSFTEENVLTNCDAITVDLGTWCLMTGPWPVPPEDVGSNDFGYAVRTCAADGGFLPTAAQLIGAAARVKLNSYLTDEPLTASIDLDATDGLADRREMSSTLVTTQSGPTASGSLGVSPDAAANPLLGQPAPVAAPAVPLPETLQYVTVVDNGDKGGFAGARPLAQAETFRCGYYKRQGPPRGEPTEDSGS